MGAGAEGEVRPCAWKWEWKLKSRIENEEGGPRPTRSSSQQERERARERRRERAPRESAQSGIQRVIFIFLLSGIAVCVVRNEICNANALQARKRKLQLVDFSTFRFQVSGESKEKK